MALLATASLIAAILLLPIAFYLGLLGLLAKEPRPALFGEPTTRFAIVVPAHNEEAQVAATVRSLQAVDYPRQQYEVFVVADNCSDRTAAVAHEAGAHVLARHDQLSRGKGYALHFAFTYLLANRTTDAVVVIDADTVVSRNLLRAFAARLEAGAHAIQAEYGVRNVDASWRTRLMVIALAMFHHTRSLARARLGLSIGLRGNGMCFSRVLLSRRPHHAHSLVEDLEYGVEIGLAGYRVAYAHEAHVLGEMVAHGEGAVSQRRRWEQGRLRLAREMVPRLLGQAWRRRSLTLFDLALDLIAPPLTYVVLAIVGGVVLELSMWRVAGDSMPGLYLWAAQLALVLIYAARGVQYSGLGWLALLTLAYAPVYVAWKVAVLLTHPLHRPNTWVRTRREGEEP